MEPIQFTLSARTGIADEEGRTRDAGARVEALDACAMTMRVGERATFECGAELAYGKEGNFSFPAVGKDRAVVLDLEILGARGSAAAPEMRQRDMTYEQRVERVRAHRSNGNAAFAGGRAREAVREYSMALTYLTEDFMMQLFDKYEVEAHEEFVAAHGNLAAAYLRLGAFEDAVTHVGYVLKVDENNAKAYYRRGKARAGLGQEDAAREDFLKAKKITEAAGLVDANVVKALREIDAAIRDRERATSAAFKGIFNTKTDGGDASSNADANVARQPPDGGGSFISRAVASLFGKSRREGRERDTSTREAACRKNRKKSQAPLRSAKSPRPEASRCASLIPGLQRCTSSARWPSARIFAASSFSTKTSPRARRTGTLASSATSTAIETRWR